MAMCWEFEEEEEDMVGEDEYAKLVRRMNPPRVVIDNDSCDIATVIRVDRVKKHGILLEAVQVLVDLDLVITKAYISSDGNWFMDVFNVTDRDGRKLVNRETIDCIQRCLESEDGHLVRPPGSAGGTASEDQPTTSVELTGADRPGLLSEVCAVLASLGCNIVKGEVWTHGGRAAAVLQITEDATGLDIRGADRQCEVQQLLDNVMRGDGGGGGVCSSGVGDIPCGTAVSVGAAHAERRLHRLMLADGDGGQDPGAEKSINTEVVVTDCAERLYTAVILRCKDRPKLLFDTLCALADLQYVVFHGTVNADGGSNEAYQEYYVRHVDGHPARTDVERLRLVQCLESAVERRASDGLELAVRTEDRAGLLSEITRVFRENGLSIIRAAINTREGVTDDTFYVSDAYGNPVDGYLVDSMRDQLGRAVLLVKHEGRVRDGVKPAEEAGNASAVSIVGNLLKGSFHGFRLVRSQS